ncbi:MAG: FKBP-type peptidyl-prolyl cis-trans isomerase [Saprospiraceae bacterium]|jgi:FKBP-type peptidyl-prolyl cis-trans isomerase FkpA|nr:FKBP-type peptidyl-prolyl cis-trans isomerase [Saprospiraceae bacterium]
MLKNFKLLAFVLPLAIFAGSCSGDKGDRIPGAAVSPSGFQYVLHTNVGGTKPQISDIVFFSADIRNRDSVVLTTRSQENLPYTPIVDPAMTVNDPSPIMEVVMNMAVGDSATIYIRIDTVANIPPGFENEKFLMYDLVVREIKTQTQFVEEQQALEEEMMARMEMVKERYEPVNADLSARVDAYNAKKLDDQITETVSGLKYIIHEQGTGPKAEAGDFVSVHYHGMLTNKEVFDSSFRPGQPINFTLGAGQVILGWDEGLAELNQGGRMTLFIPAALGYGADGSGPIPPNAELVFYVELEEVKKPN